MVVHQRAVAHLYHVLRAAAPVTPSNASGTPVTAASAAGWTADFAAASAAGAAPPTPSAGGGAGLSGGGGAGTASIVVSGLNSEKVNPGSGGVGGAGGAGGGGGEEVEFASLFDAAQREVFSLMERDSFERFKRRPQAVELAHLWALPGAAPLPPPALQAASRRR